MIDARVRKRCGEAFELDVHWKTDSKSAVVLGAAGAGKTLLIESICGFVKPDEGRIVIGGDAVFDGAGHMDVRPEHRKCAYVPSTGGLLPHMTVRENLALAAWYGGRLERRRKVDVMLEDSGLASRADVPPERLHPGEYLRASVARALLAGPRVLVIDEPEKGLDAALREEMKAAVDVASNGHGVQVVMAGRNPDMWLDLAMEVAVIDGGRLLRNGTPEDVLDEPLSAEVARLLGRYAVVDVEIVAMDPARKLSRIRCVPESEGGFEITAPYFPGLMKGARVQVAVLVERVQAMGRGEEGVPRVLERAVEGVKTVHLEFEGGVRAEVSRREWEPYRHNKNWMVMIPPEAVRLVR